MQTWFSRNGDSVPPVNASQEVEAELLDTRTPSGRGEHETQDLNAGDGTSRELSLLNHAHQAIAQVQGLDEIKNIRDKAEAVRKYAQSVGMGLELQNYAAEVKLRAERKAGELLAQLQLHGGDRKSEKAEARPKLEDIGISKDQSSRWQLTAAVSDRDFEKYVAEAKTNNGEVTTAGLLRVAKQVVAKKRKRDKQKQGRAPLTDLAFPSGVFTSLSQIAELGAAFSCLYANPMWATDLEECRSILERLAALPISELCAAESHLHLWVNEGCLFESQRLMRAWGFEFAGGFVWVKSKGSPGNYWRPAHEHLLLGVRGSLPFRDRSKVSWIQAARSAQDSKPEVIRKLIEQVSLGPYLELFRSKAGGRLDRIF
jgi:hypothetical protein